MNLHETVLRIFNKVYTIFGIEVLSIDGWHKVKSLNETDPVDVYLIETETGRKLECARDHILYTEDGSEIFAIDTLNKKVITESGPELVIKVENTGRKKKLYDLSLE